MFGSTIVDVAIGLIFVFFLLSVIASHINDLIAGWLNWRSKDLEAGIRQLLSDPELANKVWNHSLVRGVSGRQGHNPDYIPSNTFALALFDALTPGGNQPDALAMVRTNVMTLPESSARQAVVSMIDAANGNIVTARAQVENWFNAAMDRVSAVYKQRMRTLTLFVALAVTLVFGADSLAIANSLYQEPALRAAVTGYAARAQEPTAAGQPAANITGAAQKTSVGETIKSLSALTLPIGWTSLPENLNGWVQKIMGLLFTTLAVSLGAPFWYQLLKALTSVRQTTGASPQKTG